ncbi:MAG: hypothetical protein IPG84_12330 [Betaproteobacteria bacterium]|nr:hypothetical protein [Betaproteobacteria bacterium]
MRHDAAAHPAIALAVGVALATAAAVVAWSAATWPLVRQVAAELAIATMLALAWRARPDYGAGRGCRGRSVSRRHSTPSTTGATTATRPRAAQAGVQDEPVRTAVACVVGHERSGRILSDHADALVPATLPYNRLLTRGCCAT